MCFVWLLSHMWWYFGWHAPDAVIPMDIVCMCSIVWASVHCIMRRAWVWLYTSGACVLTCELACIPSSDVSVTIRLGHFICRPWWQHGGCGIDVYNVRGYSIELKKQNDVLPCVASTSGRKVSIYRKQTFDVINGSINNIKPLTYIFDRLVDFHLRLSEVDIPRCGCSSSIGVWSINE